jgi:hypothetical protein
MIKTIQAFGAIHDSSKLIESVDAVERIEYCAEAGDVIGKNADSAHRDATRVLYCGIYPAYVV